LTAEDGEQMTVQVDYQFDLFAIYASADASWVSGYLLPALGLPGSRVITVEQFDPGETWLGEFQRAVTSSRYTAVVISPTFLGDHWANQAQQLAAHLGVEERRNRLLPILLRPTELPLDLQFRVRLDYTREAEWEAQTARLRELLDRPPPAAEEIPCPYPGLTPYTEEDAQLFWGRDSEKREVLRRLAHVRSLLVIGPSGSGKSSLVFAGLLPELRRREWSGWLVRPLRPASEPLRALQSALEQSPDDRTFGDDPPAAVAALLALHPPAQRLLLVIDQFEEVLDQAPTAERDRFLAIVSALREAPACIPVLTMRADFYAEFMHTQLWPMADVERLEIIPLRGAALRQAIEQPALQRGVYLEPALIERLVADAAREPGVLPLLQETLRQLWEERRQRLLTVGAYERLGRDGASGMAVALATWADASLAALSPAEQAVARRVFLRMVHLGEGRDDTRRQQPVSALGVAGENPALLERTLSHLTERRLLTRTTSERDQDPAVDLAHEALTTSWPTLRRWVAEGREAELYRRRIERDAHEWQGAHRDRGLLYRGRRLRNARDWRLRYPHELSPSVVAFLAAGRRLDTTLKTLVALLVILLALGAARLTTPVAREYQLRRAAVAASPMASFPAGAAVLGGLGQGGPRAEQRRMLPAFSIDRHEVTNGQYRLCVQADRCSRPTEPAEFPGYDRTDRDFPVVYLTAYQAAEFCRWLGRRLPAGAEWERAVRGTSGRPWPWGTARPTGRHANLMFEKPALVRVNDQRFASGATPEGITGLVGNVWEWTSTPETCSTTPYDCRRPWNGRDKVDLLEVRGSSFLGAAESVTFVDPQASIHAAPELGFRCARTS
jgi:formylglycine-generating enzyme required for sulfatase activity